MNVRPLAAQRPLGRLLQTVTVAALRRASRPRQLRRVRRVRRLTAGFLPLVLAAGTWLVPVTFAVAAGAAAAGVAAVAAAAPAKAAVTGPVLVLLQNGESNAPETSVLQSAGYSVTQVTPATWEGMSSAAFAGYAALVIGDPSSGSCSSLIPTTGTSGSDALGTTWQSAVTGNTAVLGTAPALAGSSGAHTLITDAVGYAAAGYSTASHTGTGLYESLNCEYSSSVAGTSVPLLNGVEGIGTAGGLTVQGGLSCTDSGTLNSWEADAAGTFAGFTGAQLAAGASGSWPSPACPAQEAFDSWPAMFTPVGFDAAADAAANFTASDGTTGQPYLLLGKPVTAATAALAPAAGGEVPAGSTAGGTDNPASPGLTQDSVADPVNTENGDFTQDNSDVSVPTFGPALDFSRSYDAQQAQAQTQAGKPGPMGYGWTDDWATSLSADQPSPGDIFTISGLGTNAGQSGPAASGALDSPAEVDVSSGNTYIADALDNRIEEVAGSTGTQWGIPMTAGDIYTVAGSPTGVVGASGNGTQASSSLLDEPEGVAVDSTGMYIADTYNCRVLEIPAASGTQWGIAMTADEVYVIAGRTGDCTIGSDSKAATSSDLWWPAALHLTTTGSGDLYIADAGNNRIQEIAGTAETEWGQAMTAGDVYTIAGSPSGLAGSTGDAGPATSAGLSDPEGVTLSGGDLYIADTENCRVQEVPGETGTEWAQSMTAYDMYTVAGRTGDCTIGNDNKIATSSDLWSPTSVRIPNGNLYIADSQNNRVQEVAGTTHTEFGQSMTANFVYTIAGSATGTGGDSGNGGLAASALLDNPAGVYVTGGNVYLSDSGNNEVREVSATSSDITDTAGDGYTVFDSGDGGPATGAGLATPDGIAADAQGDVYIADSANNRVQEIAAATHTQWGISMTAGDTYTVAGSALGDSGDSGNGVKATSALLTTPISVAVDAAGNLYISDSGNSRIIEVAAATHTQWGISMTANDEYTVAGSVTGSSGDSGNGGPATSALLELAIGIAVDASGDLYIADQGNNRIQEVPASTGTHWGQSMTASDMYTVAGSATGASGTTGDGGLGTAARLQNPGGVAVDAAGDLYIADSASNRIQELAVAAGTQWGQSMHANDIYTVAGSASGAAGVSGDGGPASAALLSFPADIATDSSGDLFIADSDNNRVQEVAAANGSQWGQSMTAGDIYTVAGSASGLLGSTGTGGPASAARLDSPENVGVDADGDLFLTAAGSNTLLEATATATPAFALAPQPSNVTVSQPGGAQVTFTPQSGGACAAGLVTAGGYCVPPAFEGATLTDNTGAQTYTFTPAPGADALTYSWAGQLVSEADTAGETLTVTYLSPAPGSGNCPASASSCETITSASGRALVIGSSSAGLVTSVTDPLGRRWTYAYTGQDLTSATDPVGHVTSYTYGQGGTGSPIQANDLLTITSPSAQPGGPDAGHATVNVYNAAGQVTSQTAPAGWKTTLRYCASAATGDCMNAATGTGLVTVTDPDGNATVYDYAQGALAAQSAFTGTVLTSEQDFVPDRTDGTLLNTVTADGDGNISTYTYDAAGNQTSQTSPEGAGSQTATTTDWTSATAQGNTTCSSDEQASATCSSTATGPVPVAPGGVITPPAAAPPSGVTWSLYDTDGNDLYDTTGVYEPGSNTAAYVQTSYSLFKGNSVTLGGTTISCTAVPPSRSLPCATINPDGVVTQLAYDAQGDLASSSAPDGNGTQVATTSYGYDGDGEQTSQTAPDGNLSGANAANYTTVTAYNADGQATSVTQAGGTGATVTPRTTSYGYDADGNQVTVQDARGYTTTTAYNADDQAAEVTSPLGNATLTCYDGDGNVTQTVPPAGVSAGSLTPSSCPSAYPSGYGTRLASDATTYTFDAGGDQTVTTTPAPAGQSGHETTTVSYDGDGNPVETTAPPASGSTNEVTYDTYDAAGNLATQTTGYGTSQPSVTSYCYDPDGDQTSVVAPDGNTSGTAACETSSPWVVSATAHPGQAAYQTTASYDSMGDVVSATAPATAAAPSGGTTTYGYDAAGNLITSQDPDGVTTTSTYNAAGLLSGVSYSGSAAHSVSYTYDASGHKTGMTDATGSSSYIWDPFGELTSATNGAEQTVGLGYDGDGDTTAITYPLPASATWASTPTVSYGYSHADVLDSVTDFTGHQISVTDNADGLPSSQALGSSGDTLSTTYDPTDSPSQISLTRGSTTLQSFAYSDAPAGNILSETDTPSSAGVSAAYTYDALGRVASMTPGGGSPASYGFDASGNLTALPGGAAGSYDHDSELTAAAAGGSTTAYGYDADGRRLSATRGASVTASATWNGAGALTSYTDTAGSTTAQAYDGDGLRASGSAAPAGGSATAEDYVWNTTTPTPQLLMDSADAYIYTGSATPAEQVSLASGTASYLVADTIGSVRGVVSATTGTLTATASYDAWGNPDAGSTAAAATPFGFGGGYTDPTGLIYLVNRYYDPATGQFLSIDPQVTLTQAPYSYASGDPVSLTDPDGLCTRLKGTVRCRTDKLLWRWNTTLHRFQYIRDEVCGKPEAKCNNHGNSHGKFLNWSSDQCSGSPDDPFGWPFWKACERHDFGTRNYIDQDRCTKRIIQRINNNFYRDLIYNVCNLANHEHACDLLAASYLAAVNQFNHC